MGTDINFYIEKKVKDKWERVDIDERILPDERNSDLFYYINHEAYWSERGIPGDTSYDKTETTYLGEHSFTYFYLDERCLHYFIDESLFRETYFDVFFKLVLPRLLGCDTELEMREVRVLIGFDS